MKLTEQLIRATAGPTIFDRGLTYYRANSVTKLELQERTQTYFSKVTGTHRYTVSLKLDAEDTAPRKDETERHILERICDCSCEHSQDGYFCKHKVALCLTVLDGKVKPIPINPLLYEKTPLLTNLKKLSKIDLILLILQLSEENPAIKQKLIKQF